MIAIVDYGVGNLFSIRCSFEYIGTECKVTSDPDEIRAASKIVLPGVGAFGDAVARLRATGLDKVVIEQANAGKPLLGVCLGMQLLYEKSYEYGEHAGLGLISGEVIPLTEEKLGAPLKIPHMGWNDLAFLKNSPLLKNISNEAYVYYVHSYYASVSQDTVASSRYGNVEITGLVQRDNVFGAQFHPEKSGKIGLAILQGFAEYCG